MLSQHDRVGVKEREVKELIEPNCITEEWRQQGLSLHEPDDHVLELRLDKKVIARFSQTGVTLENILKVARRITREAKLR